MTAIGFSYHRHGLSRSVRPLYLIAALYLVFALTVCGSVLLARDLTTNPLGTGGPTAPAAQGSQNADQSPSHFKSGTGGHGGNPVHHPAPKRLRGVLETKDGASPIFAVAQPTDDTLPGTDGADSASKISFVEPVSEDHVLAYDLLRRPPPAN